MLKSQHCWCLSLNTMGWICILRRWHDLWMWSRLSTTKAMKTNDWRTKALAHNMNIFFPPGMKDESAENKSGLVPFYVVQGITRVRFPWWRPKAVTAQSSRPNPLLMSWAKNQQRWVVKTESQPSPPFTGAGSLGKIPTAVIFFFLKGKVALN